MRLFACLHPKQRREGQDEAFPEGFFARAFHPQSGGGEGDAQAATTTRAMAGRHSQDLSNELPKKFTNCKNANIRAVPGRGALPGCMGFIILRDENLGGGAPPPYQDGIGRAELPLYPFWFLRCRARDGRTPNYPPGPRFLERKYFQNSIRNLLTK